MRLRSLLYVPADNERFIVKAHERGADAIILDLEDSVRPERRDLARKNLALSVSTVREDGAQVFVRINADVPDRDAAAAKAAQADAIYVSKANISRIKALAKIAPDMTLFALIEDPAALLDVATIAAHPAVKGLSAGGEDLATALGASPDPDVLRTPKLMIHYAAKAHGKFSLGLFRSVADYTDLAGMEDAAHEARRHGFDGASCVHPSAIPILNKVFTPTTDETDWAKRVLKAAQDNQAGAFTLDGRMIDAPIIARARSIVSKI